MNKMFKKIVATTAAVSTVACLSVSAFAATAKYTEGTNSVAVTLGENEALTTGAQYTIIVVPAIWDPSVEGADDQIYYINQGAAEGENGEFETILAKAALKDGIPNGTYQVRFGTDAATSIATAEFTIGDDGVKVLWGDINLDEYVNAGDASDILMHKSGGTTIFGDFEIGQTNGVLWGDINLDGYVNAGDASDILMYKSGGTTTFGEYTINEIATISTTK